MSVTIVMSSNKPYLIRAFYQWIVDNACTPHLLVNANYPGCHVPLDYVEKNGEITLNISPLAVRGINMTNDLIEFQASFSGIVYTISVPVRAVLGIYPSGKDEEGVFFGYEEDEPEEGPKIQDKPYLKVLD